MVKIVHMIVLKSQISTLHFELPPMPVRGERGGDISPFSFSGRSHPYSDKP